MTDVRYQQADVQDCFAASANGLPLLSQLLPFTMPLPTPLIRTLLRHLNSNAFAAKASLIHAIAGFTGICS